jgi:EmrB/QacA subfamily drug resistance transporter
MPLLGLFQRPFDALRRASEGPNHKWWAFGAVSIGIFMSTLDISIVNISLPRIMAGLNTGFDSVQWVILAYLLTITSLLLAFGRLADLAGRKRVYIAGFAVFTLGNLAAALAPNVFGLTAARAFAGIGGAMLQANSIAITAAVFPERERGTALGMGGTMVAAGLVAGPTVGGILTDALGWRSVFYIAIPVGLIGIPLAMAILREEHISTPARGRREPFDWTGSILWAGFLFAFLFGLNQGASLGWQSPGILSTFVVSAVMLVAFMVVELRIAFPTMRLSLFRVWGFSAGSTSLFCSFTSQQAVVFLMPFYLQLVRGMSPRDAGVLLTTVPLAMAVAAPISGRLSDRYGSRGLSTAGLLIVAVGLAALGRATTANQVNGPLIGTFLFLGVGLGMFQSPNNNFIFASVPRQHYGIASGFIATMRNAASSLGIAAWGAILTSELTTHGFTSNLEATVANPTLKGEITPVFLNGLHIAIYAAVAVLLVGVVFSALRGPRPAQDAVGGMGPLPSPADPPDRRSEDRDDR